MPTCPPSESTPYTGNAQKASDVRRKLDVLAQHSADLGRPPESLLRSHITYPPDPGRDPRGGAGQDRCHPVVSPRAGAAESRGLQAGRGDPCYEALVAAGLQYFIATAIGLYMETLDLLAYRVIPAVVARRGSG